MTCFIKILLLVIVVTVTFASTKPSRDTGAEPVQDRFRFLTPEEGNKGSDDAHQQITQGHRVTGLAEGP